MAADIIQQIDSYTEVSPSGKGIHIIFKADDIPYNKNKFYINNQEIGLECYVSGVTNKFVTITGNMYNKNFVSDGSSSLPIILEKYMKENLLKRDQIKKVSLMICFTRQMKNG